MRRLISLLLAVSLGALTARAEDAPPPRPHPHLTWEERFAQANLAHDGHLTLEEAKGGYKTIARHFQDIDSAGKGYVTENDIRAWHAQQRAVRHPAEDPLRPRPAFHHGAPDQREQTTQTRSALVIAPETATQP